MTVNYVPVYRNDNMKRSLLFERERDASPWNELITNSNVVEWKNERGSK